MELKPIVSIENVVATGFVDQRVDLGKILKEFPDSEKKENFPGLIFKIQSPRSTTLIFTSGRMVCTGTRSANQAVTAIRTVAEKLQKAGIVTKDHLEITVRNIVASANLGYRIHLESAAKSMPRCMYEPEQFPGLIHRMVDPRSVILLFASGKLVCAGTNKEAETYRAVNNLRATLVEKNLMHGLDNIKNLTA
ncbi:MAG: TATA-box-binding protein [Thaumarchaeota archaeon]|nr:TATA-box-binding protein [Nitrososphaerota archaeon]